MFHKSGSKGLDDMKMAVWKSNDTKVLKWAFHLYPAETQLEDHLTNFNYLDRIDL